MNLVNIHVIIGSVKGHVVSISMAVHVQTEVDVLLCLVNVLELLVKQSV